MAGDWIKMGVGLRTNPKVVRISSALRADRLRVIGGLFAVWAVFDAHSPDGLLDGYTLEAMDEELSWPGFSAAMQSVGWLEESESGLAAPRYDTHNGASAKRRAMESERKRTVRESADCPHDVRDLSASDADKKRTREEKRREEKKTPPTPKGEGRFPEFWDAWPASTRKADRKKCLEKWRRHGWDEIAITIITHVSLMKATKQWLDGYEPAPLTYLNGERWLDGVSASTAATDSLFDGVKC